MNCKLIIIPTKKHISLNKPKLCGVYLYGVYIFKFSNLPRNYLNVFFHMNLLQTIINTTKKGFVKSVQPFTRDVTTKGNRD